MSDSFISRTIEDNVACRQLISGYLTEVTESMLYGLTEIKDYAFYGLAYGRSIKIPNNITSIGNYAFYDFGLAFYSLYIDLIIPNSVTNIGDGAFYDMHLSNVTVEANSPPTLGYNAFGSTSSNLKIYVPAASVEAYKTATNWSTYADKIQAIPNE